MRRAALIIGLALGGASVAPGAGAGQVVTLGASPTQGGGVFTTGGGISVAVEPQQINGAPHLCGVWARSPRLSAYVRYHVHDALSRGVVLSGDDIVLRDFRAFRQVPAAETYGGATANCVPIPRPVGPVSVRIPTHAVPTERGPGGPRNVRFKSSPKVNPAYSSRTIQNWLATTLGGGAQ